MRHADFHWSIEDGVVVIIDLDQGNCSVTNCAEDVIAEIARELPDLYTYPVIYLDSMDNWDGIRVTDDNRFGGFHSIGMTNRYSAIAFARQHFKTKLAGMQ